MQSREISSFVIAPKTNSAAMYARSDSAIEIKNPMVRLQNIADSGEKSRMDINSMTMEDRDVFAISEKVMGDILSSFFMRRRLSIS